LGIAILAKAQIQHKKHPPQADHGFYRRLKSYFLHHYHFTEISGLFYRCDGYFCNYLAIF